MVISDNIIEEENFCIMVKNFLDFVQTFYFKEISLAFKKCLVIIENCVDLFLASLNIHFFYNEVEESFVLLLALFDYLYSSI